MGFNSSYYCGGMHPFFAGGHPPPAAPMGAFFGPPVEEQMFAVATSDDQMPQAIRQNPAEVPVHGSYVADQRPQVRANSLSMERPNRDEINPCRLRDERSRSPKKDVDHRRSRLDMGHEILARNEQTALADADDLDDNDGPVGGRLPAALPCAICSTFHMAFTACTIPSNPCDICEGQHWTARCNVAALRIARVFRDGISCQKCRLMHRGSCPPPHSCPLCLTHHRGVCQPSPNACRYCGERHWENGCMRWEAKDEAMGFNTDKNPLAGRRKSVRFMCVDVMDPQKRGELPKTQPKKPEPKRTAKSAIIKIESDDEQYPIKTQPAAPALARAPSAPIFERAPSALFLSLPALATVNPPLVLAEPMKFPASLPPRPQVSREKDQQAQEWLERIERNRFPGFRQGQGPPNDHLSSMHLSDDVDDRPARLSDSTSTATLPADNSVNTNTCPGNEDNRSRPANENNRSRNRVPAAPGRKRNRNRSAETYRAVGESVRGESV